MIAVHRDQNGNHEITMNIYTKTENQLNEKVNFGFFEPLEILLSV